VGGSSDQAASAAAVEAKLRRPRAALSVGRGRGTVGRGAGASERHRGHARRHGVRGIGWKGNGGRCCRRYRRRRGGWSPSIPSHRASNPGSNWLLLVSCWAVGQHGFEHFRHASWTPTSFRPKRRRQFGPSFGTCQVGFDHAFSSLEARGHIHNSAQLIISRWRGGAQVVGTDAFRAAPPKPDCQDLRCP
jgi:hypothetical protein